MKWLPVHRGFVLFVFLGAACLPGEQAHGAGVDYALQMEKAASSMLLDIARAGQRLVAVGERGHILYSEDEGSRWVQAQVPTRVMLTRVFFIDDKYGWAVGHDGNMLHSSDGGVSWELQRDGVADQVGINEERAGRALGRVEELRLQLAVAGEGQISDLQEALDEAEWALDNTRELLDETAYAPPLMDVWFSSPEQGWAAGGYGVLLHTANGGRNWADWSHKVDNPDELHLNGVIGDQLGSLYLASEWGTIFVSHNMGESWQPAESGYDGSFFGLVVNPNSGGVYAYGLLGTIYRSADQGESWEEMNSGVSASLFGADSHDGSMIFVGQGGTATLTRDDGKTFAPLIQSQRDGLFGVTAWKDGKFMATGQGGCRVITESAQETVQ
ncbi:MAG: YCF48-related protein [Halioglobus sp.]